MTKDSDALPLLMFVRHERVSGLRTADVDVLLQRTGLKLGVITWHRPYRQYVYVPEAGSRYGVKMLLELRRYIKNLMRAWERKGPAVPYTGDYAERVIPRDPLTVNRDTGNSD